MAYELDSAEIIAYLIKRQKAIDTFSISFNKINDLGKKMEALLPEEKKKIRKLLTDALKETMLKLYQEDKKTLRERMRSTWLCRMICGN